MAVIDPFAVEPDGLTWMLRHPAPVPVLERQHLEAYHAAARRCFDQTGNFIARFALLRFVEGYPYIAQVPVNDADELRTRCRRHDERVEAWIAKGSSIYEAEVRPVIDARLRELSRLRRRSDLASRVEHLRAAIDAAAEIMGDLHWWSMTSDSDGSWSEALAQVTGEPLAAMADLLGGLDHASTRLVRRLRGLAVLAQSHAELASAVGDLDLAEARARSHDFAAGFDRLLRVAGRRTGEGFGTGISYVTPTWSMDPLVPLRAIAGYARQDLAAIAHAEADARARRRRAVARVRRRLRDDGPRLERFEDLYGRAVGYIRYMEDSNALIEQETIGTKREAVDLVGSTLVEHGWLDARDEAFHLTLEELDGVATGLLEGGTLRGLAKERAVELQRQAALRPPRVLGQPAQADERVADAPTPDHAEQLRGVGVCGGVVEGRAVVLRPGDDVPDFEVGDVLVARDAGPDLTPIFPLVVAVVLDEGAPDQHAAIMARSYGVPAVIGTRHATTTLTTGDMVRVDANEGTIDRIR